jgi:hypothetical protein
MKTRWLVVALLAGLVLSAFPPSQAVSEQADSARIARLISQLASLKFSERRQASRELDAMGEPALNALRKAMGDPDLETCHRARELVARIEKRLDAASVLAPTRLRLVCNGMPVTDAIAELARKAKIEILIDPKSRARLAQRKVTLDTGEVTFWEALDMLCQKAGLVETTLQNVPANNGHFLTTGDLAIQPMIVPNVVFPAQPIAQPAINPLLPKPKAVQPQPQKPKAAQAQPQKPREAQPQPPKDAKAQPQKPNDLKAQPQKPKAAPAQPQKPKDLKAQPQKPKPQPAPAANQAAVLRRIALQNAALFQLQQAQLAQIQFQPVPAQNLDIWVASSGQDHSRIVLADGKPEKVPTCYAGAFRIRARTAPGKDRQSPAVVFEVTAEPRHLGWSFIGNPRLDRAGDDRGQSCTLVPEDRPIDGTVRVWGPNGAVQMQMDVVYWQHGASSLPLKRTIQIQIKLGSKLGQVLKELAGRITVEARTSRQDLIVVDNVLKAGGKTTRGRRGGSIKIIEVARDKNGNHLIRFKLESPPNTASNPATTNGLTNKLWETAMTVGQGPAAAGSLSLLDGKGAAFPLIGSSVTNNKGEVVESLTFQAQQGRQPAKLVFSAQRSANVDIPFSFADVKLP